MSGKFKQLVSSSNSQDRLFHSALKAKVFNKSNVKSNVIFNKSSIGSTTNSTPSIIRIVPSKRLSTPRNNVVKTVMVQRSKNIKVKNLPSTSNNLTTAHVYINKNNQPQFMDNSSFNEFEEITNDEVTATEMIEPQMIEVQRSSPGLLTRQIENNMTSIPEKLNNVHNEHCCCSCRDTLGIILQQQKEILNYIKHSENTLFKERKLDLLPVMPFKDINDFLDFDESLVNENVQHQFATKLQKLLGSTEQKSVTNMMSSIMTNELCKSISWIGIKNTVAFGNTNMVTLIVVSSKSEQQQLRAAVSELSTPQSNGTAVPSYVSPSLKVSSSEEVSDSVEDEGAEEEDDGGLEQEDEESDDADEEEEEEEEGEDEGSKAENDDEYQDELWAVAGKAAITQPIDVKAESVDKELSELLEYKRLKNKSIPESKKTSKDKRVPTVKKELSTQKEILIADNETQVQTSNPIRLESVVDQVSDVPKDFLKNELQETENYEKGTYNEQQEPQTELRFENAYTVLRAGEVPTRLSKRQSDLLQDLKAYLNKYVAEREKLQELGSNEVLLAESLSNLLAKLPENPQRWERINQLLTNIVSDLNYTREVVEARKRLVQVSNPFVHEASTSTLTTLMPTSMSSDKSRRKSKKKKKKLHQQNLTTTTLTPLPTALATTKTISTTMESPAAAANWRLVAERLFGPHWIQKDLKDDESNVAKVHHTKPQIMGVSGPPLPFNDKDRDKLKVLKAAREYSQPRFVHFGKINTHQQASSPEDLEDGYGSKERTYQRTRIGQLASPSSSHVGEAYSQPRDHSPNQLHQQKQQQQQFDVNFVRNQEYLPSGREFAASKPWQAEAGPYGYSNPWTKLAEPKVTGWNSWRQTFSQSPVPKPWLPWHTEHNYFARLQEEEKETAKIWQQAQQRQQQNWNRHHFRENLPPWLKEKDVQRVLQTSNSWSKPEKSGEYDMRRKQNLATWENNRNNHSELKNNRQSKAGDDYKESPKLTMKTWNSLTSDPATWPFKLAGAKPWPKDVNGNSYNPNAELVRKLSLYKTGRIMPEKDAFKDLKQQKLEKGDKHGDITQTDDTWTLQWNGKVGSISSKVNPWIEPDDPQTAWYTDNHWNKDGLPSMSNNGRMWSREKISGDWSLTKAPVTSSSTWPNKWKQFAYHKVTAQPTSKSGVTLDKPYNKNAFIAVSAVSSTRYGNEWRKNDIQEIGQLSGSETITEDSDHPASQMRMNAWKKSSGINGTTIAIDSTVRIDDLENQLENLKDNGEPVLLAVNISIKNSTSHEMTIPSTSTQSIILDKRNIIEIKKELNITSKENQLKQSSN